MSKSDTSLLQGPPLEKIKINFNPITDFKRYPFSVPIIKNLTEIEFPTQVTFFVGENGSGKSTLLEALAAKVGFGPEGGSKHIYFKTSEEKTYNAAQELAEHFTLSWRQKPKNGYFFRAESFFNVANHIDYIAKEGGGEKAYAPYGGASLHEQSHGESFLAFFRNRLGNEGFFIFDEPEAALSPQRQLALMAIIHDLCKNDNSQFIIATHSPLLLAYPEAVIYSCDAETLKSVTYTDTEQYNITKSFLDNPTRYLRHLFNTSS